MPAPYGANWHPMTYSPRTGLVYIPALEIPFMHGQDNAFAQPEDLNLAVDMARPRRRTTPPRKSSCAPW